MRIDGREAKDLRPIRISANYLMHPEGSVLIEMGNTKLVCTATVEEKVPAFLKGSNKGWVTAEYGMLPRSTNTRMNREAAKGKQTGRTMEIQRLIGRALRGVTNLALLGERSIVIDCDVIQADGGTRTAAINGAYVALAIALNKLLEQGQISICPLMDNVAAVSVGIVDNNILLDLCYEEDSVAEVDMNIVLTGMGNIVEIQGTAEGMPFSKKQMDQMFEYAQMGISKIVEFQQKSIGENKNIK